MLVSTMLFKLLRVIKCIFYSSKCNNLIMYTRKNISFIYEMENFDEKKINFSIFISCDFDNIWYTCFPLLNKNFSFSEFKNPL